MKWWNDVYKINIDRKQKNRSPPSQNILNIFLSQRHLIIARLNVMIVDSNYLPSKSWSFEKKRRFVNQSICIWWSHLSFADKVCRQRRQRQFDDFSWRFFFVSGGNFAQFWKYQTIWYAFPTVFPIRILQDVLKNSTTICFFWSAPPIWRFFWRFFFRKWRQFCSPEGAATDGVFKICAARRHPRKIQANGTLRRCLRLFGII